MLSSYKQLGKKLAGYKQAQTDTRDKLVDIQLLEIKKNVDKKYFDSLSKFTSGVTDTLIERQEFLKAKTLRADKQQESDLKEARKKLMMSEPETVDMLGDMDVDDSLADDLFKQSLETVFELGTPLGTAMSNIKEQTKVESPFGETPKPSIGMIDGKIKRGTVKKYQKKPSGKIGQAFKSFFGMDG